MTTQPEDTMTELAAPADDHALRDRSVAAARLHLVSWQSLLWPWTILAIVFAVNLVIHGIIAARTDGDEAITGALTVLHVFVLVAATQNVCQLFRFGVGLGMTRRAFALGSAAFAVAQAIGYGVVLTVLLAVENASGGWGFGLRFFGFPFLETGDPVSQVIVYAVPLLTMTTLGWLLGVVRLRWGATGVTVLSVVVTILLGGIAIAITWAQTWTAFGGWFVGRTAWDLMVPWPGLAVLVLAAASWAVLRRSPA